MLSGFIARSERWPLARPFRISRGVRTETVVIVVEAYIGEVRGRGESVPYARYGETPESVLDQLAVLQRHKPSEVMREGLRTLLPPGAARNAVDCALWDLEARMRGKSVSQLLGHPSPAEYVTAITISIDTPQRMAEAARALANAPVIKIKVDAEQPRAMIEAVAKAAPDARLIVDPNESWTIDTLRELQPFLAGLGRVAFVEQPLPASRDAALETLQPLVPLCADESVHTSKDLDQVARRYQVINIKLDKTGGLTEALRLRTAARARKLQVMIGCMMCTSLSVAPALQLAASADFVDLDGPWWLAKDRERGVRINQGRITVSSPFLWGNH
jgi:L-alanine-DL-glutamate epimerase-like enolase superfamily enzyme